MSVLFEALNRAAREQRRPQARVVVPLFHFGGTQPYFWRVAIACVCVCVTISFGYFFSQRVILAAPEEVVAHTTVTSSQVAAATVPTSPKSSKMIEDESHGIELPVDALDQDIKVKGKLSDLAAKIEDTPAYKPAGGPLRDERSKNRISSAIEVEEPEPRTTNKKSYMTKAAQATESENWDLALAYYDRLLASDASDVEAMLAKAFVLEQRGGESDLKALDKMISTHSSVAAFHAAKARVLLRKNDKTGALEAWQKALAIDPGNNAYRLAFAIVLDREGRTAEALDAYRAMTSRLTPDIKARIDYLQAQLGVSSGKVTQVMNVEEEEE